MAAPKASITLGANTRDARKKIDRLGKDVSKFSQGVKKNVGGAFDFIGKVAVAGFAMLTAGKAATAIKDFATEGDRLAKTSKVIGLTAESLQELEYAAGQQGASAQSLNSAFVNMNKTLGRAKNEQGLLYSYLNKSNKGLLTQVQNAKSSEEAFSLLTNAIDQETDTATRQALATAAFGGAASDMIKMADGGTVAIDKLREGQRKHGVISNEAAAASEKFNDTMDDATRAMKGVMFTALAPLIPKFTELAQKVTDFFHANKDVIGSGIEKFFNTLGSVMSVVIDLWDSGLIPALGIAYTALVLWNGAMTAGAAIMGIYKTIQSGVAISTMFLTAKQWLLNIAMMANPIGLIIIAFVALIAVVALVIIYWDEIIEYTKELWNSFLELEIVQDIIKYFNKFVEVCKEVYDYGLALLSKGVDKLVGMWNKAKKYLPEWMGGDQPIEEPKTPVIDMPQGYEEDLGMPQGIMGNNANGLITRNQGVIESNKTTTNRSQLDVNFNNMPANVSTSRRGTAPGININTGVMQGL